MEVNNLYYNSIISSIPKDELKAIIHNEIINLMMDFGQKVVESDSEFEHVKYRTFKLLTESYPTWRIGLFDQCCREGKLNRFDKSTRITAQRIELWMSSYEKQCNYLRKEDEEIIYPYPREFYQKTAARFIPIINFRISHKPDYDGNNWTLEEIEKTIEFQEWKETHKIDKLDLSHIFRK